MKQAMTVGELIQALRRYDRDAPVVLLPDFGTDVVHAVGGVKGGWWQPFRDGSPRGEMSMEWFDGSRPVVCVDPLNGGITREATP